MKICFVINRLLAGGAQNTLKSVADGISDQNYKLKILAFEKKRNKDVKFKNNIKVSYLNKKKRNNNILNFFLFFYFILKNRNNLDCLISTGDAQTIIICRIVCFLFKIKHIPWIQFHYKTSKPRNFLKFIMWKMMFKNLNALDFKVVTCSKYIDGVYKKDFNWKKTKIIYQCIDPEYLDKSINLSFKKQIREKFKNKKVILAPGRLDKDKNHISIVKAIYKLSQIRKDFILFIHGAKGNSFKEVKQYVAVNNLSKFIIFIDLIKLNKFINWQKFSDLVILNSIQEPIGTIAYENMYIKSNFLISYQTGWKEMIPNKKLPNVILNPLDENEILKKIRKMLNKNTNKNTKSQYYKFILNYTNDKISKQWLQFLKFN